MRALAPWQRIVIIVVATIVVLALGVTFAPTGKTAFTPTEPTDLQGQVRVGESSDLNQRLQGRVYAVGLREESVRLARKLWMDFRKEDVDFVDDDDVQEEGSGGGGQSQQVASGLAFDLAGEKTEWSGNVATISSVSQGPAQQAALRAGDVIFEVNGVDVDNAVDATKLMLDGEPGRRLKLRLRRSGVELRADLTTVEPGPQEVTRSSIGAEITTLGLSVKPPENVRVTARDLDASGALALALYVFDAVAPEDLLQGRSVVAAGELSPLGEVLPVERVRLRAIAVQRSGADLFFVPEASASAARDGIESACPSDVRCVRVVPVRSFAEAVEFLRTTESDGSATAPPAAETLPAPVASPGA